MACEIGRGSLAAQITVNALVVHVEPSGHIYGVFVRSVGHAVLFQLRAHRFLKRLL